MALNIVEDKKGLANQVLPILEFSVSSRGITIYCDRLSTARFVPFDVVGRCKSCRSEAADMDYVVTNKGVSIICSRMKGTKFVPFDSVYDLPGHALIRLRSKGKVFNVPVEVTNLRNTDTDQQMDKLRIVETRANSNNSGSNRGTRGGPYSATRAAVLIAQKHAEAKTTAAASKGDEGNHQILKRPPQQPLLTEKNSNSETALKERQSDETTGGQQSKESEIMLASLAVAASVLNNYDGSDDTRVVEKMDESGGGETINKAASPANTSNNNNEVSMAGDEKIVE